jgi:hypothetical protein
MNVAHADQYEAACRDVRARLDRMREDPHPGTVLVEAKDVAIHDALSHRLGLELRASEIGRCCSRIDSPRVMYWVPRARFIFCDEHWACTRLCACFKECDACRMPVDEVTYLYLFMGPFIVQAALCISCEERATLSADRA